MTRRTFLPLAASPLFAAPRRPNILLLLTDEWRAQTLPSSGDPDLIAPNLARLARESVDFRRAYTAFPQCCPARATILTGRPPAQTGVRPHVETFPLARAADAYERMHSGKARFRAVLTMEEGAR